MQEEFNPKVFFEEHWVHGILKVVVHKRVLTVCKANAKPFIHVFNPHNNLTSYR